MDRRPIKYLCLQDQLTNGNPVPTEGFHSFLAQVCVLSQQAMASFTQVSNDKKWNISQATEIYLEHSKAEYPVPSTYI